MTGSDTADTSEPTDPEHHRWRLGLIVTVVFALLVVAITLLSVWFEMIMFSTLPTATVLPVAMASPSG